MRSTQTLSLMVALSAVLPSLFGQEGKSNCPFATAISASNQTVRSGEEIRVHVVLTNASDHTIVAERVPGSDRAEAHYDISIKDRHGSIVPLTEAGRATKAHRGDGSFIKMWIKPGEKMEENTILNNQFDLTNPGTYEIQLMRPASFDPKDGSCSSNKITITVIP
jgi:hypothetical protein